MCNNFSTFLEMEHKLNTPRKFFRLSTSSEGFSQEKTKTCYYIPNMFLREGCVIRISGQQQSCIQPKHSHKGAATKSVLIRQVAVLNGYSAYLNLIATGFWVKQKIRLITSFLEGFLSVFHNTTPNMTHVTRRCTYQQQGHIILKCIRNFHNLESLQSCNPAVNLTANMADDIAVMSFAKILQAQCVSLVNVRA